uniref:Uncharacterized protein n=1 Tax=Arundo donax TaxID=35708 RepID=A0A0A9CTJ5_ARUDO
MSFKTVFMLDMTVESIVGRELTAESSSGLCPCLIWLPAEDPMSRARRCSTRKSKPMNGSMKLFCTSASALRTNSEKVMIELALLSSSDICEVVTAARFF